MKRPRPPLPVQQLTQLMDTRTNRLLVASSIVYVIPGLLLLVAADVVLARDAVAASPVAECLAGELGAALYLGAALVAGALFVAFGRRLFGSGLPKSP